MKITVLPALLPSLTACTVIPPQVAHTGPSVGVVAVGPVPYYAPPGPYHVRPLYRGYYGYRHGYRNW